MSTLDRSTLVHILRVLAKAARLARGGFTKQERRQLAADLMELAAVVLADVAEPPDATK
jgi:hypothetical protein